MVLNRLFEIFDRDQNGAVDQKEFLAGLSVLCHGGRDQKIKVSLFVFCEGKAFIAFRMRT